MKTSLMNIKRLLLPAFAGLAVLGSSMLSSCEDMMDVKSDDYLGIGDNKLNSANDSLYSAMGILTQMQKLGERYVLLGELRGDLMETTEDAPVWMQQVGSFATTADNEMSLRRDYYSVINNCNFALNRMDTTVVEHLNKVMLPEYTAIRTMRDWTYLQLGLTYGRVQWLDKPILSLEESMAQYPYIEFDELVKRLVEDLEPYGANSVPEHYGSVDGLSSRTFFLEPRLLLGDLYLLQNRYSEAARMYYDYIRIHQLKISELYGNTWENNQANAVGYEGAVRAYNEEALVSIPYPSDPKKERPDLLNITYNETPAVRAASWWIEDLKEATHFFAAGYGTTSITGYLNGDIRGEWFFTDGTTQAVAAGDIILGGNAGTLGNLVTKFALGAYETETTNPANPLVSGLMMRHVATYRIPHVYLRYAEAVNRMGKPTLAFAVLKHGLSPETMADETKVNPEELADDLAYTNFSNTVFENNRGTASRGRGTGIGFPRSTYVIPEFATEQETIEWVEDEIVRELAAETMFEGNRFFDLMRVSRHRGGTEYFAEKVSRRFDNQASAKALLQNSDNWWLK